jgi:hypothetical protein
MVLQKYVYIFSIFIYFLDIFTIQEYLDLYYPIFHYEIWQIYLMYAHYLSRKFYKYASLSLALPFNVYLSPLIMYDTFLKSFLLCRPGRLP